METKQKRVNHLQVLVEDEVRQKVNRLITIKALQEGIKPQSLSAYVRDLLLREIDNNELELKMFSKSNIQKVNERL